MNWEWASSLDQIWRSPTFPMWLTLAAAVFFGLVFLVTLLRAERSVANGALAVMTLLAIAVAAAGTMRSSGQSGSEPRDQIASAPSVSVPTLPALACIDDIAGETTLAACEKILFGSPDATAAAVTYAAMLVSRLTAQGDVAAANRVMSPELQALRRAVERDRYGLVAYVLSVRDHCQPGQCAAFASLTDHNQIAANMDERIYEALIIKYAPSWNTPATPSGALAGLPASLPTGKPTNADFPTSASIPPVNIMTPEPTAAAPRPPVAANAQAAPPRPAAKKQAPPKARAPAPVQLAPAPGSAPAAADQ